jgi:hypothetical protein
MGGPRLSVTRIRLAPLLLFLIATTARGQDPPAWDPAKTWVFSTSVTTWKDKSLESFTSPRLDDDMVATFKKRGVPEDHVVYLRDENGTLAAMRSELRAIAGKAGPGSTLVFSFQGHGDRSHGRTILCCHDVDTNDMEKTGFAVDEIAPALDGWKGERLILLGDCCHSGGLGSVVAEMEKRRPDVRAAALTSATASNRSTTHWTFTEAVIAALSGDGAVDANGDGRITFKEADDFIHDEMKWAEGQLSRATRGKTFEEGFVLAKVERPLEKKTEGDWKTGDYLEAKDQEGTWWGARVIDARKGEWRVHFPGWDAKWDEWVSLDRVRKLERRPLKVGERYEVEWEHKDWWVAAVLDVREDYFWFVHYAAETGEDDEWITSDRARDLKAGAGRPDFAPIETAKIAKGDVVAAKWKKGWWLAKLDSIDGVLHRVKYDDGTDGAVLADELIPVAKDADVAAGDRVLACWKEGDAQMYPGVVAEKGEKGIVVKWDDGSEPSPALAGKIARVKVAK